MSKPDDGGAAFPRVGFYPAGTNEMHVEDIRQAMDTITRPENGMTLRDYFAAKAMQGLIHDVLIDQSMEDRLMKNGLKVEDFKPFLADFAYDVADAMIARRNDPVKATGKVLVEPKNLADMVPAEALTTNEKKFLVLYMKKTGNTVNLASVKRASDRPFDFHFGGMKKSGGGIGYEAWAILAGIADLTLWTCDEIANMTDYPSMAASGDWSGVRDTDKEKLRTIFAKYVLPQITKN